MMLNNNQSLNHISIWRICYLDVNWLIPKISACRARIWTLVVSEWSERVTTSYSVEQADKLCFGEAYFEYFESYDFLRENTNIDVSVFMFDLRIINMSSECEYDRFCLPMPFHFRKHKGHDLTCDVKIMTSQQRLSRIVTSTFL
jgi:hypothetical protein